jgi:hypothetical protein
MVEHPWHVPQSGLTKQVSLSDMSLFMSVCPEVRYPTGSAVFRIGDPAEHLHVITRGQVKLVVGTPRGQERILSVCGPDDLIGEAFVRDAIGWAADAASAVLALDLPSGLDATSGHPAAAAVRAGATVTLAAPKTGLAAPASAAHVGELYLADIGIPAEAYGGMLDVAAVSEWFVEDDVVRLR